MKREREFNSKKSQNQINFERDIDRQFFERVYSNSLSVYRNRLSQISIKNKKLVLDAGCGFGQWTLGLSQLNETVISIDADLKKVKIAKLKAQMEKRENISFKVGSIENLPFPNEMFDAVFCYSVIYRTNYKKSLSEFFRVLKPQGIVYVVANGIGWYFYNLLTGHSSARDFNARIHSIQSICHSIKYQFKDYKNTNVDLILTPNTLFKEMKLIGFRKIITKPEGHICIESNQKNPFYPKKFLGLTNVFEVLAKK